MPYPEHFSVEAGDIPVVRVTDAGVSAVVAVRRTIPTDGPTDFLYPYGPPTPPPVTECQVRLSIGVLCGRRMVGLGDGVPRCRHHFAMWRERHEQIVLALRAQNGGGTDGA